MSDDIINKHYACLLEETLPHKDHGRIVIVDEKDFSEDDFRPPSGYYIIDYFGKIVFIKTISRKKAQEIVNSMYGTNKFTVKKVIKAEAR